MARSDSIGFFWQDEAKVKPPKKEKPKAIPPLPFWEDPSYLPGLEEARNFKTDLFTDMELYQASLHGDKLIFDIEVYPNYCLFAFKSISSHKVVYFELDDHGPLQDQLDLAKLQWVLNNFCIIDFNGLKYDFPVTSVALVGHGSAALWDATVMIIQLELKSKDVYKKYKCKSLRVNQIDLIELTALGPGLKVCAGRLHAKKMQDLPFKAGTWLSEDQIAILRAYCINDLDNTELLYRSLVKQIELRETMGVRFGIDLRSLSDAQMAEAIISAEIKRITGRKYLSRTTIDPDTTYRFQTPHFIKYSTPLMNHMLAIVQNAVFGLNPGDGSILMPPELSNVIHIGNGKYKLGIGGLHSQEKSIAHVADDEYFIADTDATSYYPFLILNAGIAPENLGHDFLVIYNGIVIERVNAKQANNIIVAECLKIVANGTFGKLGSMWSIVYAPNLLLQVTITGQLSILMLVERFELSGIEVISVNTDGIVVRCHRTMEATFKGIVQGWEKETGFNTEEVRYKATYSRDINNYIAVYETPQKGEVFKTKGVYAKTSSKKNAVTEICVDAIKQFIATSCPVEDTIRNCRDITKFTSMRAVKNGGAVKPDPCDPGTAASSGIYLGKVIRWYYSTEAQGNIVYAKTGNKVALTDGAKPLMTLPDRFPEDIDYDWYIRSTYTILQQIGYLKKDCETGEEVLPDEEEAQII